MTNPRRPGLLALLVLVLLFGSLARAQEPAAPEKPLQPVQVTAEAAAIDLTDAVGRYRSSGDTIQVQTIPGPDGIVRRIAVRPRVEGARPDWIVFALTNSSDEQIERLLVAPHSRLVGSGVVWPDLGSTRITAVTAAQGFSPERQPSPDADVFSVTLDPGATVTFVAELATPNLPQLYLWEPDAYKDKINGLTLYQGIVIGVAGLLALFLTIVVVVKGAVIFPAAAALAWAVLLYVCIDFGFWQKVLALSPEDLQVHRAGAEATLAATSLVFLFAYLNLNRWHVRYSRLTAVWLVFLVGLVALSVVNAPVAAGVARISLATVASVGLLLVLALALQRYDRAVLLIPTWLLLLLWTGAAGLVVSGRIANDLAAPALLGGLVLIVLLIGFTVMQHAFAGGGVSASGVVGDTERKALALTGAGDCVFDWDVPGDRIYVSPEVEGWLGLKRGALCGPAAAWLDVIHPFDRDRYAAGLDAVLATRGGRVAQDFRLKARDGHYLWFGLKARPVVGADGEVGRVVGTLADVTEARKAEERMLHDAVRDSLTGLPNRGLFLDRVASSLTLARTGGGPRPTVIAIDVDRFKQLNQEVGLALGDSILLTLARRLGRLLRPQDALARVTGDEFAILLLSETEPEAVTAYAAAVHRALEPRIAYDDREVSVTTSIGVALDDGREGVKPEELLADAEVAMLHAKRGGGARVEVFRPAMRRPQPEAASLEADLRRAIDRGEIDVAYQPIVRLEDRTVAGFEALVRWEHPRLGNLPPAQFIPLAEETRLVVPLGLYVLERAARELAAWQGALDVDPPIFVAVNVSSRQLFRNDLVHDVKTLLARVGVARGSLKLEITESLAMENPEQAAQVLQRLKDLGAGLALDDFGTGHSSLAYLQRFPVDTIKIDRSLVRAGTGRARSPILRAVASLAAELGLDAVAEGVETEAEVAEVTDLGLAFAQGEAFGRPMRARDARRFVGVVGDAA